MAACYVDRQRKNWWHGDNNTSPTYVGSIDLEVAVWSGSNGTGCIDNKVT